MAGTNTGEFLRLSEGLRSDTNANSQSFSIDGIPNMRWNMLVIAKRVSEFFGSTPGMLVIAFSTGIDDSWSSAFPEAIYQFTGCRGGSNKDNTSYFFQRLVPQFIKGHSCLEDTVQITSDFVVAALTRDGCNWVMDKHLGPADFGTRADNNEFMELQCAELHDSSILMEDLRVSSPRITSPDSNTLTSLAVGLSGLHNKSQTALFRNNKWVECLVGSLGATAVADITAGDVTCIDAANGALGRLDNDILTEDYPAFNAKNIANLLSWSVSRTATKASSSGKFDGFHVLQLMKGDGTKMPYNNGILANMLDLLYRALMNIFQDAVIPAGQVFYNLLQPIITALRSQARVGDSSLANNSVEFNVERISNLFCDLRAEEVKTSTSHVNILDVVDELMLSKFIIATWNQMFINEQLLSLSKVLEENKKLKQSAAQQVKPSNTKRQAPGGGGLAATQSKGSPKKKANTGGQPTGANAPAPSPAPVNKPNTSEMFCVFHLKHLLGLRPKGCEHGNRCDWFHPTNPPSGAAEKAEWVSKVQASFTNPTLVTSLVDKIKALV